MKLNNELNEYKVYSTDIFWDPISKGIENVKSAFSTGFKDVWGSISYAFKVAIELDKNKINELKRNRKDALNKLTIEYKNLWKNVVSTNEDISTFAMIAAPGPYFVAYLRMNGRVNLQDLSGFCKDAGVSAPILNKFLGNPVDSEGDIEYTKRLMLRRATDGSQRTDIERVLSNVVNKIEKIMQLNASNLNEYKGIQAIRNKLQEKDENRTKTPEQELISRFENLFSSKEFNEIINKKINSSKFLLAKKEEIETYVNALEAPVKFIDIVESATGLDEILKAYKELNNTILKIDGLNESDPSKKIREEADKKFQEINRMDEKKKKEIENSFLKTAQIQLDENKMSDKTYRDEMVDAAIIKIITIKQLQQIKDVIANEKLQQSLESARQEFIKSFKNGFDDELLNSMKKIDSTVPDLIESGVRKIKNAGLLKK